MIYQYLLSNEQCVKEVTSKKLINEKIVLAFANTNLTEGELPYNECKQIEKGQHICKYCHYNIVDSPDEDVLCSECSELFGHGFYSEL